MMTATFATLVICKAGMNVIIAAVESEATISGWSIATRLCKRPGLRSPRERVISPEANTPRQNRMVQKSWVSSRVKKGACSRRSRLR